MQKRQSPYRAGSHILGAVLLAAVPAAAFAAGGGGHGKPPSFTDVVPYLFDFIVYSTVLYFLCRKAAKQFWHDRRRDLQQQVDSGKEELNTAWERAQAAETQVAALGQRIRELGATIEDEGKQEAAAIVQEAEEKAEVVAEQTQLAAKAERASSLSKVREEVVDQIIARAEQRLLDELGADQDRQLREPMLAGIRALVH